MHVLRARLLAAALIAGAAAAPDVARADLPVPTNPTVLPPDGGDRTACDVATRSAERQTGVPDELLTAISRVEAGRSDPTTGTVRGWPWTIDVEGVGHLYPTEAAAIAAVQSYEAGGARSIDVGCMQVNLRQHPEAFATLAEAFDPATNALWAAHFLTDLFHETGSWPHAAAAYHSMTPELGANYQEQVLRMWAEGDGDGTGPFNRRSAAGGARGEPRTKGTSVHPAGGTDVAAAGAIGGRPWGADHAALISSHYGPPSGGGTGRGLAAYRAMPIMLASRPPSRSRW